MGYEGFVVIGAGPAGAAFAYLASRKFNSHVVVYEARSRPGLKACGWGLVRGVEEYIGVIPKRYVLNKIKGFRIYYDDVELVDYSSRRSIAYMVDRPSLLEYLLSSENISFHRNRFVRLNHVLGVHEGYLPVIATGFMWKTRLRDLMLGVEFLVEGIRLSEPEYFELRTWSGFVGYLWVFPFNDRVAHIGIGGYADYNELVERLNQYVKSRFSSYRVRRVLVGYVSVSGLSREFLDPSYPIIGEAMGMVLPLTGEGMRPSIASAWSLVEALSRGDWRLYTKIIDRMGWRKLIELQLRILRYVVKRRNVFNVEKLKSLVSECEWVVYELAFKKPSTLTMLRLLSCGLGKALSITRIIRRFSV